MMERKIKQASTETLRLMEYVSGGPKNTGKVSMTEREKCCWCGDRIHRAPIKIQQGVYHRRCVPKTILSFEVAEIITSLKNLEENGSDVSEARKAVDRLTAALETIE